MKLTRQNSNILILIGDLVFIPLSFILGHYLRFGNFDELFLKVPPISLVLITIGYIFIFYLFNLYELKKDYLRFFSLAGWIGGVLAGAIVVSFLNYGLFLDPIGRGIFVYANVSILILAFGLRFLFFHLFKFIFKPKKTIVLGNESSGREIFIVLRKYPSDFDPIGFMGKEAEKDSSYPYLGNIDQMLQISRDLKIDTAVNALSIEETKRVGKDLMSLRISGVQIIDMPDLYQVLEKRIPIDYISEVWFLKARGFTWSEDSWLVKVKRTLDFIFSLTILLAAIPLILLTSLMVKISSRGPVFYVQERVGRNNIPFKLIKFRSMIDKAENEKAVWAEENDKRVTPLGRVLRKLHIDELPQLINVLKGEMSLVGARPERPVFVDEFNKSIPFYSVRHFLRPGLTGWAQVNYPYASSIEASKDKLEYDLYYVYHMTLLLDLRILLQTFRNVFKRTQ